VDWGIDRGMEEFWVVSVSIGRDGIAVGCLVASHVQFSLFVLQQEPHTTPKLSEHLLECS
jgi:predicted cupin superfamily sugar epimerase